MLKRNVQVLLSLLIAGLFLCACGNAESKSDEVNQSSKLNLKQKVLRRGNGSDVETLDPQLARSESALNVVRDMYEGLVRQNQLGEIVPAVAESWMFSDDDQCYQFVLSKDAKWSNGDVVVPQDFIRAWEFALDSKNAAPYAELLKPINNAGAILAGELSPDNLDVYPVDERTLAICLEQSSADFLARLALPVFYPRHNDASAVTLSTEGQITSNGAYQLQERVPQSHITLTKNKTYYDVDKAYFETVKYFTTEDANSELKRYLAGELDITVTIPPNDVKRLKEKEGRSVRIAPVLNTYFYGFNLEAEPFKNNLKLRRALSLVVDRDILVNKILGTGEQAAWTLVPSMIANYQEISHPDSLLTEQERLELAKTLYQEAGYSKSNPVKFELRYNTSPLHKKLAVAIATMWKEQLGAEVELYNEEWKVFVQNRRAGNTQMFRSGWIADVNDASNYLQLFSLNSRLNDYAYKSTNFTSNLTLAQSSLENRTELLAEAEQILLQDYAIIPLYYYVSKHMVRPDILGWEDNVLDVHLSRDLSRRSSRKSPADK